MANDLLHTMTVYPLPLPSGSSGGLHLPIPLDSEDIESLIEQLDAYVALIKAQSRARKKAPEEPPHRPPTVVQVPVALPPAIPPPRSRGDRLLEILLDSNMDLSLEDLRKMAGYIRDDTVREELDKLVRDGTIYQVASDRYSVTPPNVPDVEPEPVIEETAPAPVEQPKNEKPANAWPIAILVGGPADLYRELRRKVAMKGIELRYHLASDKKRQDHIPRDVDVVMSLLDFGGQDAIIEKDKERGLPIIRSHRKWASLSIAIDQQFLEKRSA